MWHSASVPKQKWDFQFRLCCVWSFSSDQSSDLQLKQVSQLSKVALLSEERKRINMIHQKYWHKRCLIFERFLLNSHTACLYQARRYVLTHRSLSERKWKVIWILLSQFLLSLCSFTENTYNWNPKTLQILKPNLNFSCKNTSNQTVHYLYFVFENMPVCYIYKVSIVIFSWSIFNFFVRSWWTAGGPLARPWWTTHWTTGPTMVYQGPLIGPLDHLPCSLAEQDDHCPHFSPVWVFIYTVCTQLREAGVCFHCWRLCVCTLVVCTDLKIHPLLL